LVVIGTEGKNLHHLLLLSLVPKGEICTICFGCHWYRREKSAPFAFIVIGTEGRNLSFQEKGWGCVRLPTGKKVSSI